MACKMYCTMDVNKLHREGSLQPGWVGGLQWTCDGEEFAAINLRADAAGLHLTYRVRGGGEWEDLAETVRIVRLPCRFGGARPYFICPGVVNGISCIRRVAKLYGPGPYFVCRHCCRLAHASQSEAAWDRELRRAEEIRQRLGAAIPTQPLPSHRSRSACGDAPMNACASKPWRRKWRPMKPSCSASNAPWRGST